MTDHFLFVRKSQGAQHKIKFPTGRLQHCLSWNCTCRSHLHFFPFPQASHPADRQTPCFPMSCICSLFSISSAPSGTTHYFFCLDDYSVLLVTSSAFLFYLFHNSLSSQELEWAAVRSQISPVKTFLIAFENNQLSTMLYTALCDFSLITHLFLLSCPHSNQCDPSSLPPKRLVFALVFTVLSPWNSLPPLIANSASSFIS